MTDDHVLLGWWCRPAGNWAVRNLMEHEPSPAEEWEPVFLQKDGAAEFLAYRTALRELMEATERWTAAATGKDLDTARSALVDPLANARSLVERRGSPE